MGNFNSQYGMDFHKTKFQLSLRRPTDVDFGPDFELAVKKLEKLQDAIARMDNKRYLVLRQGGDVSLRFSSPMFELKVCQNPPAPLSTWWSSFFFLTRIRPRSVSSPHILSDIHLYCFNSRRNDAYLANHGHTGKGGTRENRTFAFRPSTSSLWPKSKICRTGPCTVCAARISCRSTLPRQTLPYAVC